MLSPRSDPRRAPALPLLAVLALWAGKADAQSWADDRRTPALRELVTVDGTGEPNWVFGYEDIAGDGAATFSAEEQAADVRSAYAVLRSRRLWLRVYVAANAAPTNLRVYAFIDTDRRSTTGGDANAPALDAALVGDPSPGGYELVIGIRQEANQASVWLWDERSSSYEPLTELTPLDLVVENGTDRDPLGIGSLPNGYVQGALDVSSLGISSTCDATLSFRATDGEGLSDRDVGSAGPCVPDDENRNGVADVAETTSACSADEQCPGGGECTDGSCRVPAAPGMCSIDEDCAAGAECVAGSCRVPALSLRPGERVQGGALTCSVGRRGSQHDVGAWIGLGLALAALRRARRSSAGGEDR